MRNKIFAGVFMFLCVLMVGMWCDYVSGDLRDNLVRLHIIANSDSEFDQNVKLKVRDRLLYLSEQRGHTPTAQQMTKAANDVLRDEGVDYTARITYGKYNIDRREYEGFILPEGVYRAVRIELGQGQGKNWWCVLSPPVCFTKSAVRLREELEDNLSAETTELVTGRKITPKLKLVEIFSSIKAMQKLQN